MLKEIKTDNLLKYIPVIILTNSNEDKDIESYEHHANAYMSKPIDSDKFKEDISIFKEF